MGGMIAQELVLEKPHYVKSLCLTSTTSGMTLPPLTGVMTIGRLFLIRDPMQKTRILLNLLYPQEWLKAPAPTGSSHKTNEEFLLEDLRRRIERTRLQPINAEQLGVDVECWEGSGHALCSEQSEKYNAMLEKHFQKAGLI
ncbi:14949_t:CDS:2 [Acaulospora morrowiae]|uniref:14949_t:CDS:1 n=1 Tax=Acaulospora morrowiae TaxID=94023 RepID=A0A9N9JCZ0_9GLOM|nr:14949_t:CDS:2 [Acaulospora morrowiae]